MDKVKSLGYEIVQEEQDVRENVVLLSDAGINGREEIQ